MSALHWTGTMLPALRLDDRFRWGLNRVFSRSCLRDRRHLAPRRRFERAPSGDFWQGDIRLPCSMIHGGAA